MAQAGLSDIERRVLHRAARAEGVGRPMLAVFDSDVERDAVRGLLKRRLLATASRRCRLLTAFEITAAAHEALR
jgi:hypothetical protein